MRIELTTFPTCVGMLYQFSITDTIEPLMRIELTTSSLPRKCSTPELQRLVVQWVWLTSTKLCKRTSWAGDRARTGHLKLGRLPLYQMSYSRFLINITFITSKAHEVSFHSAISWAQKDSNLRSRKTADLQSAHVDRLWNVPRQQLDSCRLYSKKSHLSDSNQRPADYKSAALPAELKWHFYCEMLAAKN